MSETALSQYLTSDSPTIAMRNAAMHELRALSTSALYQQKLDEVAGKLVLTAEAEKQAKEHEQAIKEQVLATLEEAHPETVARIRQYQQLSKETHETQLALQHGEHATEYRTYSAQRGLLLAQSSFGSTPPLSEEQLVDETLKSIKSGPAKSALREYAEKEHAKSKLRKETEEAEGYQEYLKTFTTAIKQKKAEILGSLTSAKVTDYEQRVAKKKLERDTGSMAQTEAAHETYQDLTITCKTAWQRLLNLSNAFGDDEQDMQATIWCGTVVEIKEPAVDSSWNKEDDASRQECTALEFEKQQRAAIAALEAWIRERFPESKSTTSHIGPTEEEKDAEPPVFADWSLAIGMGAADWSSLMIYSQLALVQEQSRSASPQLDDEQCREKREAGLALVETLNNDLDKFMQEKHYNHPGQITAYTHRTANLMTTSNSAKSLSKHHGFRQHQTAIVGGLLVLGVIVPGLLVLAGLAAYSKATRGTWDFFKSDGAVQRDNTASTLATNASHLVPPVH